MGAMASSRRRRNDASGPDSRSSPAFSVASAFSSGSCGCSEGPAVVSGSPSGAAVSASAAGASSSCGGEAWVLEWQPNS